MSDGRALARTVEECWRRVRDKIEGIDLSAPVYPDPLWTVRDVLIHCAFWNDESVKSLNAHRNGGSYRTDTGAASFAEGLDAMNERVVEAARSLSAGEVKNRWVMAQNGFTEVLLSLDDDAMLRPITCPWGEEEPVAEMVEDALGHEQNHIDDVMAAIGATEKTE